MCGAFMNVFVRSFYQISLFHTDEMLLLQFIGNFQESCGVRTGWGAGKWTVVLFLIFCFRLLLSSRYLLENWQIRYGQMHMLLHFITYHPSCPVNEL